MKNKDTIERVREEFKGKIVEAMEGGNEEKIAETFMAFSEGIRDEMLKEANEILEKGDGNILAARGIRQLTSEEREYWQSVTDAMRGAAPQQALSTTHVMPKTIIEAVFDDLTENHELLEVVNFVNVESMTEFIMNTNENQLAAWGTLTDKIIKELTSGFQKKSIEQNKLSAFIPIAKAMLDLGPEWLDRYIRTILAEALSLGLEYAIINGTGKNEPIGMIRQVGAGVTVTGGVYPKKDVVKIYDFEPATYGNLIANMSITPNGHTRSVSEVILIVNPLDYFKKVMPATTIKAPDGSYINNVLPFPTRVIKSSQMEKGRAVMGLVGRYFAGLGTGKSGKIEYSDEYRFLEDERVYLVKLYGNGQPKDDTAFLYLDIEDLQPNRYEVNAVNVKSVELSKLAIGNLELSPSFAGGVTTYTVKTTDSTNKITATPKDGTATVTIKNGTTAVESGASATWMAGANEVTVTVKNGTAERIYKVVVTK